MKGIRTAVPLAVAIAAALASCEDDGGEYEYFDYSYIDTVRAADTIVNGLPVEIVYYLPGGCNRFERFESEERGDTLGLSVVLCFYFNGMPCAHGPGYATGTYPLRFSGTGQRYLRYRAEESAWVVRDVFVR